MIRGEQVHGGGLQGPVRRVEQYGTGSKRYDYTGPYAKHRQEAVVGSRYLATCTGLIRMAAAGGARTRADLRATGFTARPAPRTGVSSVKTRSLQEQVAVLGSLIALEVATAPLGTSTGAFTFTFDTGLNTFRRGSSSFGPAFRRLRSLTIGKGKFGVGSHWLHAEYGTLRGMEPPER